jgi:succinate dehydrogenase / fumarate reductase cytochrome b subunit
MTAWRETFGSSIGLKAVMGVTGAILVAFVVGHMLGNLQIFLGPDALNHYGQLLRTLPELLWAVRAVLVLAVVLHAAVAVRLTLENRAARGARYGKSRTIAVGIPARTLAWSGAAVGAFVAYHLMHFTFRTTHPEFAHLVDAQGRHDVYSMVVLGFSDPAISSMYVVAQGLLAMHLAHGASSFLQTLGLASPRWQGLASRLGPSLAWIILIGNASIPVAVLLGFLRIQKGG